MSKSAIQYNTFVLGLSHCLLQFCLIFPAKVLKAFKLIGIHVGPFLHEVSSGKRRGEDWLHLKKALSVVPDINFSIKVLRALQLKESMS